MRVIVTGGAGFIGSHLADALVARGDDVLVLDDLSTGRTANLEPALAAGAQLSETDVRNFAETRRVTSEFRADVVFHLAAQVDVRKSLEDPAFDAAVNVVGTVNVLEAARLAGARRVINTSTGGAIYGEVDELPTSESAPVRPMAAYGQSKASAEGYCGLYTRLYGLSTLSLRYGNVFGPRQDPTGEAGVIAIFCGLAQRGLPPTVFGDGRQTRDYVYVGDIVRANLLAADRPDVTGALNVGTGVETSVLELVTEIERAARLASGEFAPRFAPARLGELARSCLDVTAARRRLGFTAQTTLREGIERTLQALRT